MPGGYVYLGEAAGGRILRTSVGSVQVGDPYNLDVYTWDDRPAGDNGEGVFRWLTVLLKHTNGYNVNITPVIDGVPRGTGANFSAGPPPSSELEEVARLTQWPMARGNRMGVIVTTLQLLGPTELVDVEYSFAPIRTGP
ncbi:MAG TPA: hypothetical protein VEU74_12125 [Gemmatimonadales bacterium]|nr:hypothetical protein [Gemmatimonadales bacterium]